MKINKKRSKKEWVFRFIEKTEAHIERLVKEGKYERALHEIALCADIEYQHNQHYTDDKLEGFIEIIEKGLLKNKRIDFEKRTIDKIENNRRIILFYDGFGLDFRGLALAYIKTFMDLGYKIVYVTRENPENGLHELHILTESYDVEWIYLKEKSDYIHRIYELFDVMNQYRPDSGLLYSFPYDVVAFVVFSHFDKRMDRYLINLTDHAFWIGKRCVDYIFSGRDLGYMINKKYRGVSDKKNLRTTVAPPYIDFSFEFEGIPDKIRDRRFIFSGGALYKTLGDKDKRYYYIVDKILEQNSDICFWYAGNGDMRELEKILLKYSERAIHTGERQDYIQVMRRCVLYLNTYPFLGGLMTSYCAALGKVPITLRHGKDSDGMLPHEEKMKFLYDDPNELIADTHRMLTNPSYLKKREELMKWGVSTWEEFHTEMDQIMNYHTTNNKVVDADVDTEAFREGYDKRFDFSRTAASAIKRHGAYEALLFMRVSDLCGIVKFISKRFISSVKKNVV